VPDELREGVPQDAWERAQLARAQKGDAQAFGDVLKRYQTRIYSLVRRLVARPAEAQELTQEVFLQAFKSQARFDPNRPFRPWLYRIAVNVCQNHRRHASRRELAQPPLDHLTPLWGALPATPEQAAVHQDDAQRLETYLLRLKPSDRELLLLRFWEELDYAELVRIYHLPQTVLKMRVHRALNTLRQWVEGGRS